MCIRDRLTLIFKRRASSKLNISNTIDYSVTLREDKQSYIDDEKSRNETNEFVAFCYCLFACQKLITFDDKLQPNSHCYYSHRTVDNVFTCTVHIEDKHAVYQALY